MATIDFDFRNQIIQSDIGNTLAYCYQCATCSGACPVAQVTKGEYNPRRLILDSLLGLKEKIFGLENIFGIWGCTVCDTCDEVCPQKVELTEIFTLIKNLCFESGKVPEAYIAQGRSVLENGVAIPYSKAILTRREKLGLPVIKNAQIDEIKTILKETEFENHIPKEVE